MPLTRNESRRLQEVIDEIQQVESRLRVSHGIGDSSSSQGISTSFSDNPQWRNRLSILRVLRNQLEAKDAGEPIPSAPGVTVSCYVPTGATVTDHNYVNA